MMSHRILPAALLLCTVAAACGELPTQNDPQAQPVGASFDGGYTIGSGNSATASTGFGVGSGDTATEGGGFGVESGNGTGTAESGTTESGGDAADGGYTIGSGN
jgi:hypothetical protein